MANEPSRITDNLLNIFNYSFVETVPYEFFKPRPERSYDEVSQVGGYGGGYSGQKQRAPRPPRKD